MTSTARYLASGPGWRVDDVVCRAGPGDRSFEEMHAGFSVGAVLSGTFRYRSAHGEALMVPGTLLLGNAGGCFECRHDHSRGDRCLAFQFSCDYLDAVAREVPGACDIRFRAPRIAPHEAMERLFAEADIARDEGDGAELADIALRFAGAALALSGKPSPPPAPSHADERRVATVIRLIDRDASRPIDLADMAGEAATSPYHFLRVFRAVTGQTPHQYVLRRRMGDAARRLRTTDDQVSAVALDAGFNDLSTFNRRFKRIMGQSPQGFRQRR